MDALRLEAGKEPLHGVVEETELEIILRELSPYKNKWCKELQADIFMLPHGYLIRDYDVDTDKFLSTCFIPKDNKR